MDHVLARNQLKAEENQHKPFLRCGPHLRWSAGRAHRRWRYWSPRPAGRGGVEVSCGRGATGARWWSCGAAECCTAASDSGPDTPRYTCRSRASVLRPCVTLTLARTHAHTHTHTHTHTHHPDWACFFTYPSSLPMATTFPSGFQLRSVCGDSLCCWRSRPHLHNLFKSPPLSFRYIQHNYVTSSRSGAAPCGHWWRTLMSLVSRISLSMSEASALSLDGSCCRMTPSPAQLYRLQLGFPSAAPERHTHPINTAVTQQPSQRWRLIHPHSWTIVSGTQSWSLSQRQKEEKQLVVPLQAEPDS